jgi:hypothetical protein
LVAVLPHNWTLFNLLFDWSDHLIFLRRLVQEKRGLLGLGLGVRVHLHDILSDVVSREDQGLT